MCLHEWDAPNIITSPGKCPVPTSMGCILDIIWLPALAAAGR